MLSPSEFLALLHELDISFFCGVPDSLLAPFSACLADTVDARNHVVAANEGNAVGIAAGHYLASGKPALVYMQNSGIGNAVNPLLSLTAPEVYSIPVLLLVGWRGQPGTADEPQHAKQGAVTPALFAAMDLPCVVLPRHPEAARQALETATAYMRDCRTPYALIVEQDTFAAHSSRVQEPDSSTLERERAIHSIASLLPENAIIVSTTGKISRELFEYRAGRQGGHHRDFLTVGSMGHASSIALGLAMEKSERAVVCIDGDGSAIMHAGALAVLAHQALPNLLHIVLNNFSHDSVGGQPTVANTIDFPSLALASGYSAAHRARTEEDIAALLPRLLRHAGPSFLEIQVRKGSRKDLGRPTRTPAENKAEFMRFVAAT